MTTVFLTGASGFLGGHLLRELRGGCPLVSRQTKKDP
jgi:thioester reductase-like protein